MEEMRMKDANILTACGYFYEHLGPDTYGSMMETDLPPNRPLRIGCVPKPILGRVDGVHTVWHRMGFPCNCSDNTDKPVFCAIEKDDGSLVLDKHLPGECKGTRYLEEKNGNISSAS
jgi:hypothetical protein